MSPRSAIANQVAQMTGSPEIAEAFFEEGITLVQLY